LTVFSLFSLLPTFPLPALRATLSCLQERENIPFLPEKSMSNVPSDLKYTETHEWVRLEDDGTVAIGITDHAQEALGDIVFLELPEAGRTLALKEGCAIVESVKAASDIYAPLAGEVTAVNQAVIDAPESVNADAYAAWLFKLRPAADTDMATLLLDAATYQFVLAEE
jgi:glycine cleavage system H protein